MINTDKNTIWDDIIQDYNCNGKSLAIGFYSTNGELLNANKAMCFFLDADEKQLQPVNRIVNPDFDALLLSNVEGEMFSGLMTIGNLNDVSYVLDAKVYRKGDEVAVFAEANTPHLFQENAKMSHLNQEVNNLQRQLIKEKKNLQLTLDELKATQNMLIHSEKMNAIGKLVAGIAHEINNPISFVYSNLFLLESNTNELINAYTKVDSIIESGADSELIEKLSLIKKENELSYVTEDISDIIKESKIGINRVKEIVENLRAFSRLDESEFKHIDLVENVKSTIAIARYEIGEKNINFVFSSPSKIKLDCYPGQLNQALLNIIINATQAVEKGGEIIFSIEEQDNQVLIKVQDNGCGIAKENMNKIFDPFFTTKPVGDGTGLGLSITYKIIKELHEGSIKVESVLGKGTTFNILVPKIII